MEFRTQGEVFAHVKVACNQATIGLPYYYRIPVNLRMSRLEKREQRAIAQRNRLFISHTLYVGRSIKLPLLLLLITSTQEGGVLLREERRAHCEAPAPAETPGPKDPSPNPDLKTDPVLKTNKTDPAQVPTNKKPKEKGAAKHHPKKKHTKEGRKGGGHAVNDEADNFEGVPKLPKMKPLANETIRQRPEAKREEVRTMKRMFDEGYNAVRDKATPRVRNNLIVLNFLFFVLSVVKLFSNLGLLIARALTIVEPLFDYDIYSDPIYRIIVHGSIITLFFQFWMLIADCVLIHQMFRQDSKTLIWVFGLSSSLTFFVLTLGSINRECPLRSGRKWVVTSLVGSYLASADQPMINSEQLFADNECCGFESPLDWHKEKVFEWDSILTNSKMTIQQNFSWVDECSEKLNKKPDDNYLCILPTFCGLTGNDYYTNVTNYTENDLKLLIQEERRVRATLFKPSLLNGLPEGCISKINRELKRYNTVFIVTTVLLALVLPLQTFLISVSFLNDNAIGRMVKIDGEPMMEKLEKCGALAFFKRMDLSLGVKTKKQIMMSTED